MNSENNNYDPPNIEHFTRIQNWAPSQAKWTTSKGQKMPVSQMTEIHLQRTLVHLKKRKMRQVAELARMRSGRTDFDLADYERIQSNIFETESWIVLMEKELDQRIRERTPDNTFQKQS